MTDRPKGEAGFRRVRRIAGGAAASAAETQGADHPAREESKGPLPRWTKQRREDFLSVLAETCNVSEAARSVQMDRSGVYALKARDADFAQAWRAALERGYSELELHLIRQARDGTWRTEKIYDLEKDDVTHIKFTHSFPLTVGIHLLNAHRAQVQAYRREAVKDDAPDEAAALEAELNRIRERLLEPTNLTGESGDGETTPEGSDVGD